MDVKECPAHGVGCETWDDIHAIEVPALYGCTECGIGIMTEYEAREHFNTSGHEVHTLLESS